MVRYADDFVILCRSREEAERALGTGEGMDGDSRTELASGQDADRGCHASERLRLPGLPLRARQRHGRARRAWRSSRTRSGRRRDAPTGTACRVIIGDVNRTLRGWFEYFKHSYRTTFPATRQLDADAASQHLCASGKAGKDAGEATTITAGPIASLLSMGCSP